MQWSEVNALSYPTKIPVPTPLAEVIACPLCRGHQQKLVSAYEGKRLFRCRECGGSFVWPMPSDTALAAQFQADRTSVSTAKFDYETSRQKVLQRVADYIQARRPAGTILDVGCATGYFLTHFFGKTEWQLRGIELSPWAAEQAAQDGIDVFRGNIHQSRLDARSMDVITVLDAFYYFPEPQSELAEFRRVLKNDGLLVLEMPAAASRIWRLSGVLGKRLSGTERPLLATSNHLYYYTPKTISRLLERCGFRVQAIVCLPGNRQEHGLRDFLYRGYSRVSRAMQALTASRIFLGPRFLVTAEKQPSNYLDQNSNHPRLVRHQSGRGKDTGCETLS